MTALKLQKLVYYAQAWSLALENRPLFAEPIEAWDRGPVVRTLWQAHRGQWQIDRLPESDTSALTVEDRDILNAVLARYGGLNPEVLSELTHVEEPWRLAHAQGHTTPIDRQHMAMYYRKLGQELIQEISSEDPLDPFSFRVAGGDYARKPA